MKLQAYVEQAETHFDMEPWKWKDLAKRPMWAYQFLRGAPCSAWRTQRGEIQSPRWEDLKACIETLLAEGRDTHEVANEKWMAATQGTEQSPLAFLQYLRVLLPDLDTHFCQPETFKMKFRTGLNSANRKLTDSLPPKDHKSLTVDKLAEWLQQQGAF